MWDPLDDLSLPTQTTAAVRVLVAVVPSPADWARIHDEHWYRIPVARAPKQLAVQYLAFYHTARFPELRWQIRYYAPVLRYSVLSRRELLPTEPDHPRADALYYQIELGPLIELPHSVPSAKLRRVTFISTTLERLLGAQDVADLWPRETARDRLWRALQLREMNARRDYIIREGRESYVVDLAVLGPQKLGIHLIEHGASAPSAMPGATLSGSPLSAPGWLWEQFTVAQIMNDTSRCVERIRTLVQRWPGLA